MAGPNQALNRDLRRDPKTAKAPSWRWRLSEIAVPLSEAAEDLTKLWRVLNVVKDRMAERCLCHPACFSPSIRPRPDLKGHHANRTFRGLAARLRQARGELSGRLRRGGNLALATGRDHRPRRRRRAERHAVAQHPAAHDAADLCRAPQPGSPGAGHRLRLALYGPGGRVSGLQREPGPRQPQGPGGGRLPGARLYAFQPARRRGGL